MEEGAEEIMSEKAIKQSFSFNRIVTSTHDAIFMAGVAAVSVFVLYACGYVGCVFSWTGSDNIGTVNYEYAGSIDKKGNFSKAR